MTRLVPAATLRVTVIHLCGLEIFSATVQFDFADINLRQAALKDIQELKTKLRTAIKRQHTAKNVTLRDKVSFVIGTTLAM